MNNNVFKENSVPADVHDAHPEKSPEKERLKRVLRQMPAAVYIVQDQKFRFVNPQFEEMTGYTKEELVGTYAMELVVPADRAMVRKNAITMLRGKRSYAYDHGFLARNGDIRRAIQMLSSIDYGGRRATLGNCMDITELLQIKESLKSSKDRFYDVFRSSPDGVVICALEDGFYIDVNRAFLSLTGYNREEVVGRADRELKIWAGNNERVGMVDMLLEKGNVRNLETRFRMKSGEKRTILWSAEIIDFGGEKCLVGTAHDITDRKHAEEKHLELERQKGPAMLVTQLGLTMVGSILLCFAIGYYLDKWLNTEGIFITIFIILGVLGGGYTVYRQIMEAIDLPEKGKNQDE